MVPDGTLFPREQKLPQGFIYRENFLTDSEEQRLIEVIQSLNLRPLIFQGFEAKRKVESYGYNYHFDSRSISKGKAIPVGFDFLLEKAAKFFGLAPSSFEEVLVTEYPAGSVINWHRDAPPFDMIIGISLLSDCAFRFRPLEKTKQGRGSIVSIPVKKRSIYLLAGQSRSEWEHSISPVREKRYSITLRTLRK